MWRSFVTIDILLVVGRVHLEMTDYFIVPLPVIASSLLFLVGFSLSCVLPPPLPPSLPFMVLMMFVSPHCPRRAVLILRLVVHACVPALGP